MRASVNFSFTSRLLVWTWLVVPLAACSEDGEPDPTPYEYADELESTEAIPTARFGHVATLLDDGRVMLIGGVRGSPTDLGDDAYVAEVALFDPADETFKLGAALASARTGLTATRVADGRVVVLGGTTLNESGLPSQARAIEVWDPATELFSTVGELPAGAMLGHCAPVLGTDVLVIDECYPGACTPLRISPAGGITTLAGDPSYRYGIDVDCAPLPDGRMLLAGGIDVVDLLDVPSEYAEIYDPQMETFERVGPMSAAHGAKSKLIALATGDVLILGDATYPTTLGQLYSPSTNSFTALTGEIANRVEHSLTLLGDGRVLVLGGRLPDYEFALGLDLFDPTDNSWSSITSSYGARVGHTAVRLDGGPVLIAGGDDGTGFQADAWLYR